VRVGPFELISLATSYVDCFNTWSNVGSGRSRRNCGLTTRAWCSCRSSIRNFNTGYLSLSGQLLPKQGDRDHWRNDLTYSLEKETPPVADFDGSLIFG
jgi:hypothetical protein